jgi:DNA-binding transcriptional regulator YhcF (GntR family)
VKISIDRSQATPVYVQIKAQITYLIGLGVLASGQRLPTIRRLASELEVAPLTVVQAFNELAKEGLVELRPGVGTFVVDLHPDLLAQSRRAVVNDVVRRSLDDANRHGLSEREFARALWDQVFPGLEAGRSERRAIFVGNYEDDTPLLAAMVAKELAVHNLSVEPFTIQALRNPSAETRALLEAVDLIIAVPLRFAEVRRLNGETKLVFGLPLRLSQATQEQLAHIPETTSVGMVVTESEFMQSMRNVVAIYRPASAAAAVASMEDENQVLALLANVDVVIYSMGTRERIRPLIPRNVLPIELFHIPDSEALRDLRHVLDQLAVDGERASTRQLEGLLADG